MGVSCGSLRNVASLAERTPIDASDADSGTSDSARDVLRRLALPVYLPITASTLGVGVLVPVLPLYLTESGLSIAFTSLILAAVGAGAFVGGLPAGAVIARVGSQRILDWSLVVLALSTMLLGATTFAVALVALRMAAGAANVSIRISRQTYITRRVATRLRGRSMALIGGAFRLSMFLGPLLGGVLADTIGFAWTFLVAGLFSGAGLVPALLSRRDPLPALDGRERPSRPAPLLASLRRHLRLLMTAGVVPLLVMTAREGRYVVLPLIGNELGLSAAAVGAVVAIGTAADLLLFPVAGWIMDRWGRLAAMVPAFSLIAVGLVMLGFAGSTSAVIVAGVVMGIGNGMSAGTMLTLGSDLAPPDATSQFLAGIAVMQDVGRITGPLVVGLVGAWLDLGAASVALACVLGLALLWLLTVIGETSRRPPPVQPA